MFQETLNYHTSGRGLHLITQELQQIVDGQLPENGLLHLFLQHTSASLLIQENADPSARRDLESFLERLAPENQSWHEHTLEGPDDTTSHMKATLTSPFLSLPITGGALGLGTWQGIYLWEHRKKPQKRRLLLTVLSG